MSLLQFSDAILHSRYGSDLLDGKLCVINYRSKAMRRLHLSKKGGGALLLWKKTSKENPLQSKTGRWKLETWKEEEKDLPLAWALKALNSCLRQWATRALTLYDATRRLSLSACRLARLHQPLFFRTHSDELRRHPIGERVGASSLLLVSQRARNLSANWNSGQALDVHSMRP